MPEKVSVVVPLYNAEKYLSKALSSILDQTYRDLRVYVIDDFSTDSSPEIVQKFAQSDKRVEYHKMPKKGGSPAPTKNEGLRLAQGAFIAFCDHDDWWDKNKLSEQVTYLETHEKVNLLGCNTEIVDPETGKDFGPFWHSAPPETGAKLRRLALEGPIFASTTCMIGRADFLKKHPFDEHYVGADEYDLSLHTLLDKADQVALQPQVLAFWRWHSESLSHSKTAAHRSLVDEEYFTSKLLERSDLSEVERQVVMEKLWIVRRRAANQLLVEGKRQEARALYQKIVAGSRAPQRLIRLTLALDTFLPPLARAVVKVKKQASYARPIFR